MSAIRHVFPLAAAVWLLGSAAAVAQTRGTPRTPTDADVERARQTQPVISDADIERARRANRTPTEAELSRVPVPSTPNVDALPRPQTKRPIDLESLARGYESGGGPQLPDSRLETPGLLVFVSFAVPEPTLTRLVDQAARAKATLVLRGFVNGSLKETVARVQRLMGSRTVSFQIDPQAFDRFGVNVSPTFVLVRAGAIAGDCGAGSCFPPSAFAAVSGDVSLDYALDHIRRSAPAFGKDATAFLQRLKGKP